MEATLELEGWESGFRFLSSAFGRISLSTIPDMQFWEGSYFFIK